MSADGSMTAVDLFGGLGGSSEGAEQADVRVKWAANHKPLAVSMYKANHPTVEVACQDLRQADWTRIPRTDVMLASPACQGHSPARGKDKPHHDATRATAWAVVDCAECHRHELVIVENVPEFAEWNLYPSWVDAMHRLGYSLQEHVVDAADHGVPQHRERLIIVCTRSRAPLKLRLPRRRHVPISKFLEWDKHPWSAIRKPGRAAKTLARIKAGRAEFGDRFLAPYYGSGSGLTGRSIHRPLGTVTTKDRWALIDGSRMRMLQVPEYRAACGFRSTYLLPSSKNEAVHLLGNAVPPPMMRDVLIAARRQA